MSQTGSNWIGFWCLLMNPPTRSQQLGCSVWKKTHKTLKDSIAWNNLIFSWTSSSGLCKILGITGCQEVYVFWGFGPYTGWGAWELWQRWLTWLPKRLYPCPVGRRSGGIWLPVCRKGKPNIICKEPWPCLHACIHVLLSISSWSVGLLRAD